MNRNRVLVAAAVAATTSTYVVAANARSVEITSNWCPGLEILSSTEVAPQQIIATYKVSGGIRSTPTGSMFDLMNGVCQGILSTAGGETTAAGNCLWVDKDGDKVVFSYSRIAPAPGKLEFTLGTGKFSGIRGGGEYTTVPLPAIAGSRNSCPEAKWMFTLPD
jgi:hypothetical protein